MRTLRQTLQLFAWGFGFLIMSLMFLPMSCAVTR